MAHLKSNNVKVFPSAFRTKIPNGKYTTEENFINIINSIVDYNKNMDGYIISATASIIKIIIHGYYFEISTTDSALANKQNLWAYIKVEEGNNDTASDALVSWNASINLDSGDEFKALYIGSNEGVTRGKQKDDTYVYGLQLYSGGKLCVENMARIDTSHIMHSLTNKLLSEVLKENATSITNINTNINNLNSNKSNTLQAGSYITISDVTQTGTNKKFVNVGLNNTATTFLNSTKTNTPNNKLIHISENKIAQSNAKIAVPTDPSTTTNGKIITMYLNNGVFTAGKTIYTSTKGPSGGNVGDIWFKYDPNSTV